MDIKNRMCDVWSVEASELEHLCRNIDFENVNKLILELENARKNKGKIFFAGVGTSAAAAKKVAHTFSCVEFPSVFLSPGDAVHGSMGAVQPGDVAVLISKGGGTKEIVRLIDSLKKKSVVVIGVTENTESELGKLADLTIKIKIEREPDMFNMLATASTAAVIAFFDAVAICLMERSGFTREQFAIIHSGGAVGDRLLGRSDTMEVKNEGSSI